MIIAGADHRHDRIVRNPLRQVGNHLDGRRCQPFTADIYVPIPAGHRRQGDLGIDFGVRARPTLVAPQDVASGPGV